MGKDNKTIKESILQLAKENNLEVSVFGGVLDQILELEGKNTDTKNALELANVNIEKLTKEFEDLQEKNKTLEEEKTKLSQDLNTMKLNYIERFESGNFSQQKDNAQCEDINAKEDITINDLFINQ